jgi:hypothetical protein
MSDSLYLAKNGRFCRAIVPRRWECIVRLSHIMQFILNPLHTWKFECGTTTFKYPLTAEL